MKESAEEDLQFKLLSERIEYEEEIFNDYLTYQKVLNRLLEDSKFIALSLRFPYQNYTNRKLPNKYKNWQLRCCEEIYNGIGNVGIKSYSENGLAWTRDSGYISYELRSEIEPMVGYIKVKTTDDEEKDTNLKEDEYGTTELHTKE